MHKNILITGATSGIGKAAALQLAKQGHKILFNSRNPMRGEKVRDELISASGNDQIFTLPADLASFQQIKAFAEGVQKKMPTIDVLINNAGMFASEVRLTEDEFEEMLAVNHLAPFLLTGLLLDNLKQSTAARIINVSSAAHRNGNVYFDDMNGEKEFKPFRRYGDTKLMNILFTRHLAKRLAETSITVNSLHPGVVSTNVAREFPAWARKLFEWLSMSPEKGARTTVYLATQAEGGEVSGEYFVKSKLAKLSANAKDMNLAARLWQWSEEATGFSY
ncbi:MAG: SDR family oxidoreductase [Bacteroidota bacterium]